MPAGLYDIVCEQGATFTRPITWKDATGDPVNLTGFSARMQVRPSTGSATVVLDLTSSNGGIVFGTPRSSGYFEITVSATNTAALTPGTYVYDLELVAGSNIVTRLLEGKFTIKPEVTR